jgi:hypothetical protein
MIEEVYPSQFPIFRNKINIWSENAGSVLNRSNLLSIALIGLVGFSA